MPVPSVVRRRSGRQYRARPPSVPAMVRSPSVAGPSVVGSGEVFAGAVTVHNDGIRSHAERLVGGAVDRSALALAFSPTDAASAEVLVAGESFYPRMLDDISAATSSIHINQFGFKPGVIGGRFAELLSAKARNGVAVRLVVDFRGSDPEGGSKPLYDDLAAAVVQVCVTRAVMPRTAVGPLGAGGSVRWNLDGLGHFDHRKLAVIDGRIG